MLGGLADEAEGVRTAALAAGRTLVDLYTLTALELLLPAILAGTSHANWRIRQSSVELLGDLLYKVAEHSLLCLLISFYLLAAHFPASHAGYGCVLGAFAKLSPLRCAAASLTGV